MAKIVVTLQAEDSTKWEEGYRSHGDLFRRMTGSSSHFTTTQDNEVCIFMEVDDVDKYMEILESDETVEAMGNDGVKRETVKVYVLDKEFTY